MGKRNYEYDLRVDNRQNFAIPVIDAELPPNVDVPEYLSMVGTDQYQFMNALLGSPATQSLFVIENGERKYKNVTYDCDTDTKRIQLGKNIWTELPPDIGTACCHQVPDVDGDTSYAVPMRLCLKDCMNDMEEHWQRMVRQNFALFGGRGATEEYWNMLRAWFVFFQARDIMYGQVGVTGNNVPSFPGVLDLMNKAVVSISGTDVIGAFEQVDCRFNLLPGNYVFGGNRMTVRSIKKAVSRGNVLYNGFTMNGDTLYFRGHPFLEDLNIPINVEAGTGQIWVADLNKAGIAMERNLSDPIIQIQREYNDSLSGECFEVCNFLKNYGFAFAKDYNAIFRMTDIPLDGACLGENTLLGLGQLISPDTLIPTYA